MKIRMGFVPNSSSSSFIVQVWLELFEKKGRVISTAIEQKLVKYGFKKTHIINPDMYCEDQFGKLPETERSYPYNYGYAVSCNQADVIRFLVNNRIPFKASEHYGHRTLIYEGRDQVWSLPNYGLMFCKSYSENMAEAIGKLVVQNEGIHTINISHYMNKKEQKAYIDSLLRGSIKKKRK